MPTVLRRDGFEVRIYTSDHMPEHVHIARGDGRMIVDIRTLTTRRITNMSDRDVRTALEIVVENQDFLLTEWERIGPIP